MGVSFDVVKGIELILNAGENIQGLGTPGIGDEWMNDCDIYGTYRFRLRYTAQRGIDTHDDDLPEAVFCKIWFVIAVNRRYQTLLFHVGRYEKEREKHA